MTNIAPIADSSAPQQLSVTFNPNLFTEVDGELVSLPEWVQYMPDQYIDLGAIPRYNSSLTVSILPEFGPLSMDMTLSEFHRVAESLTPEQQYQEIVKCKLNPAYFLNEYCWIRHPTRGIIRMRLFGYQRYKVLPTFLSQQSMITRKFRQGGFSTVGGGFALWSALFEKDREIMIISKSDREALNIMSMVLQMWDNLPKWMRCKTVGKSRKRTLQLSTGSRIWAFTPKAGRSFGLSMLILDEAAFVPGMEDVWADISPTVSTGGQIFVISTVNGVGNWYHQYYEGAVPGGNGFVRLNVSFKEHPDYCKPEWEALWRARLGERRFRQEVLAEFLGSNETYLPYSSVSYWIDATEQTPPVRRADLPLAHGSAIKDCFWFWKDPEPRRTYTLGCDVGSGGGEDAADSAIVVIDDATLEQVAEFACNAISPPDFAKVIAKLGRHYNEALVVVESNTFGKVVLKTLIEQMNYENVFWETPNRAGITITGKTRLVLLEQFMRATAMKRFTMRSRRMAGQWSTFVYNSKRDRPEHLPKYKDDLIFAGSHAVAAREEAVRGMSIFGSQDAEEARPLFEFTQDEEAALDRAIRGVTEEYDEPMLPVVSSSAAPDAPSPTVVTDVFGNPLPRGAGGGADGYFDGQDNSWLFS